MTKIEWTHRPGTKGEVWNPVTGCTKVSAGCKYCYAERVFPRAYNKDRIIVATPSDGCTLGLIRPDTVTGHWSRKRKFTDVKCHPERLDQPLRWKKPRTIFVNSMSDLFHESIPYYFLHDVFATMAAAKQHTFIVLTKRPLRMYEYLNSKYFPDGFYEDYKIDCTWPLPNVWLGISIEDQETADERIPILLDTRAAVRFISAEPLLGHVDITEYLWGVDSPCNSCPKDVDCECGWNTRKQNGLSCIDWVICGGESGPKARSMDIRWPISLRDQCKDADVPFFMKQLSQSHGLIGRLTNHKSFNDFPIQLQVREWPE